MPSVETPSTPATTGKMAGNKESIKVLDDLMSKLTVSKEQNDINAATHNLAVFINGPIEENDAPTKYVLESLHFCSVTLRPKAVDASSSTEDPLLRLWLCCVFRLENGHPTRAQKST